jgi:hypothetical protein
MNASNKQVDLDSLLDSTLDDLADMPEFKPFPAGAHRATIHMEVKLVNEIPSLDIKLTGIETVELANPEDQPLKEGDSTNQLIMLKKKDGTKNEFSEGKMKELLKPLAAQFGTSTNRETIEASNGAEVLVVTKLRKDDRNKDDVKHYTEIVSWQVV